MVVSETLPENLATLIDSTDATLLKPSPVTLRLFVYRIERVKFPPLHLDESCIVSEVEDTVHTPNESTLAN